MVDYVALTAIAQRLITENGRLATFVAFDNVSANITKPWEGPDDPRTTPVASDVYSVVNVEPSGTVALGSSQKVTDLAKRSEKILIVSAGVQVDMSIYDEVIDESVTYKIEGIEILRPGSITVLSFVGLKR